MHCVFVIRCRLYCRLYCPSEYLLHFKAEVVDNFSRGRSAFYDYLRAARSGVSGLFMWPRPAGQEITEAER